MSKKKEEKKEEKEENLLKELCGDDSKLYDCLGLTLYLNPLAAIPDKGLDILTGEGEKNGNFRPALDKAIFEGAKNPGERERYVKVIRDLASKAISAAEREKAKVEKEGLTDQAASLGRRIEDQKFMSEKAEDIINVAAKFYNERLVELGEKVRREARGEEIREAVREEQRTEEMQKTGREARKKEKRKMGREEKRKAEAQDKRDELAAGEMRKAREVERAKVKGEEQKIEEMEKAGREARKKERGEN